MDTRRGGRGWAWTLAGNPWTLAALVLRALHLAWEYPPRLSGGLGRHVEGLLPALGRLGVGVTVATPWLDGDEGQPVADVRVLRGADPGPGLPPDRWLAETLEANVAMAERVLRAGVVADVVHVHDWMAGFAGRVVAPALGLPVVVTVHATERGRHAGHLPAGYSPWIDEQERRLVAVADRIIVCSRAMATQVTEWLGADPTRLSVIPGGVDPDVWHVHARRHEDRIVFAGRLEYEKGAQVLIEATRGLAAEVVVAGTGTMAPELRRLAHAGVRFAGHLERPALARLLASAAVAVVPSLYEPFGLVALEAMAAGAPLVASDVGGLAEMALGAGVLVPPGDVAALGQALRELLANAGRRRALSQAGRLRAESFGWDTAAKGVRGLYAELLAAG